MRRLLGPVIETCIVCLGSPAVGSDRDVARLLSVTRLSAARMTGRGVLVAVVDTGINKAYVDKKGRRTKIDVAKSWTPPGVATAPGNHPVNHGTMCAYDIGIAAPQATLLDYAVLLSRGRGRRRCPGFSAMPSPRMLSSSG